MDFYPILLAFACIGGGATLVLISFCITLTGSISPEGWSAGGGLGPITLLLLPKRTLELRLFERIMYTYIIPEEAEETTGEEEEQAADGEDDEGSDILKEAEEKTGFPLSALLKLPISIDSVWISGRIGTGDAGETGKLYGWAAALRGALQTTRIHLNITPDFAESGWSAKIRIRIRVRSILHLVLALVPFVKR
jgi:hypothetical protein